MSHPETNGPEAEAGDNFVIRGFSCIPPWVCAGIFFGAVLGPSQLKFGNASAWENGAYGAAVGAAVGLAFGLFVWAFFPYKAIPPAESEDTAPTPSISSQPTYELSIAHPADMEAFGKRLARHLFPGAVVALIGGLGAGKTFLVRAIAEELGVKAGIVTSPTFVLIQEYAGTLPIYHFDAYRLSSPSEFLDLGAHEYFQGDGVCLIEWADKVIPCLPAERLVIRIEATGDEERRIEIAPLGDRYRQLASAIF